MTERKNHACAIVRVSNLLAIAPFVSSEANRFYLNGVYIEPSKKGGVLIVAMDGPAMTIIHDRMGSVSGTPRIWKNPTKETFLPAYRAWKKGKSGDLWAKFYTEPGGDRSITLFDRAGDDHTTDRVVQTLPGDFEINAIYPQYQKVIPKIDAGTSRQPIMHISDFQLDRIARFSRVFSNKSSFHCMTLVGGEDTSDPCLAFYKNNDNGDDAITVVMPVRESASPLPVLPDWLG